MPGFYDRDLAFIHDAGFREYAQGAAPHVLRELRAAGVHGGDSVVELGCGSGVLTAALAGAGYDVLGVDVSAPMLDIARDHVPNAEFRLGSLHEADLPIRDATVAVGEVVAYGEGNLERTFGRLRTALHPGGLLLFDAPLTGRRLGKQWHSGDGWTIESESTSDGRRLERRIITSLRLPDGAWRRDEELHILRLYEPDELIELLDLAGFDARRLAPGESWADHIPGMAAFAAVRPG